MKVSSAVLAMVFASASAFVPSPKVASQCRLQSSVMEKSEVAEVKTVETTPAPAVEIAAASETANVAMIKVDEGDAVSRIVPGRYDDSDMSIAVPFLKRPTNLDGTHAGDYGFDPLGLSEEYDLYTMQESEIRHGRLAMLAVLGWPMSELLAPDWMLQENGCAPSVLNGFNPISFVGTALFFAAAGFFEYKTSLRRVNSTPMGVQHSEDMSDVWEYGVAGDYNFDPLGLYSCIGDDAIARKGLRDVEISHGRSAMLGITGFAGWEALTGHAIVENSMFFHPNLLLPALAASYAFASSIYEVENDGQYIKVKTSSEGQARLENLKISLNGVTSTVSPEQAAAGADVAKDVFEKVVNAAKGLKGKYDSLSDDYTKSVMKNID